jgi:hypothetical protein
LFSLVNGREISLALLVFALIATTYSMLRAMQGKIPTIRELPAMTAIKEAVGRCVEMGKPIMYAGGNSLSGLSSPRGPGHMAGLGILGEVASQSAKINGEVMALVSWPEQLPIALAMVEMAYNSSGNPGGFKPENIAFISERSWPYCIGVMGLVEKVRPASCVFVGSFSGEALLMCETASMFGSLVIGGTESATQMPYFVAVCDYVFIGPEIFAGEAAATGNPALLGSLLGEDILKAATILLIFAGLALSFVGIRLG